MAAADWDAFTFEAWPVDERETHVEVTVDSKAYLNDPTTLSTDELHAYLVARRRAARILGRVLAGLVRDLEEVRRDHRCHPVEGCGLYASDAVLNAVTGNLGDTPWIAVTVPANQAKRWRARLVRDVKTVIADDAAIEETARRIEGGDVPMWFYPTAPGSGEPVQPHPELAAYRAARDAAGGS